MTYCCEKCFKDAHIIKTIRQNGTLGNCDFCSSKNIPVIDISYSNPVSDMMIKLVQAYSVSEEENAKPIKEALRDDWDIFNGGCEVILALVKSLCSKEISEKDDIFTKKVIISQMYDEDFQHEFGLLRGLSWGEFSEYIKYNNRFHNAYFNNEEFASVLTYLRKEYNKNTVFYRARICSKPDGYKISEMFAPPKGLRKPGRINPEEIVALYLSSNDETILYETRANVYDYITIGEFIAKRDLKLVDLSGFSQISPFAYEESFLERFAINRNVLHDISQEISKPVRRHDSPFEYLPTQYISEFIKSQGYDGVAYESTIKKGSYNFALFDESLVECTKVNTVEIQSIEYKTDKDN